MSTAKTLPTKFEVNTTNLQHRVISIVTTLRMNQNLLFNGDILSSSLLRDSDTENQIGHKTCQLQKTFLAKFEVNTTNFQHRVISVVTTHKIN